MRRRRAIQLVGAGIFGATAGCLGGATDGESTPSPTTEPTPGSEPEPTTAPPTEETPTESGIDHAGTLEKTIATNGDYPADETPADGYPPVFDDTPSAPDVDPSSFETIDVNDESVKLAPIDVVIDWYYRGEARFVDARGLGQYRHAHVYGAVNSPAVLESRGGMVPGWPTDDRIVTYCGCPHHLSSIRAAGLQKVGVTEVYALDEGFKGSPESWDELGYPMAGTRFVDESQREVRSAEFTGSVDPRHAGSYVWASAGRQYEAAPIDADGRYAIHFRTVGLDPDTPVEVRTPEGMETYTLSALL